jgi:hypothetical protein
MNLALEFERAFNWFNPHLFGSSLKFPQFQIDIKKKVCFKFEAHLFVVGVEFHQITEQELTISFIHEIIHFHHSQQGVIDVTRNQYHNKNFAKTAANLGFYVGQDKNKGWSNLFIENPNNKQILQTPQKDNNLKLKNVVNNFIWDYSKIKAINAEIQKLHLQSNVKSKQFFLKYQCKCPSPHNSIRSGRRPDGKNALEIFCRKCNSEFFCVSEY